jgi:hypothetical protein
MLVKFEEQTRPNEPKINRLLQLLRPITYRLNSLVVLDSLFLYRYNVHWNAIAKEIKDNLLPRLDQLYGPPIITDDGHPSSDVTGLEPNAKIVLEIDAIRQRLMPLLKPVPSGMDS